MVIAIGIYITLWKQLNNDWSVKGDGVQYSYNYSSKKHWTNYNRVTDQQLNFWE